MKKTLFILLIGAAFAANAATTSTIATPTTATKYTTSTWNGTLTLTLPSIDVSELSGNGKYTSSSFSGTYSSADLSSDVSVNARATNQYVYGFTEYDLYYNTLLAGNGNQWQDSNYVISFSATENVPVASTLTDDYYLVGTWTLKFTPTAFKGLVQDDYDYSNATLTATITTTMKTGALSRDTNGSNMELTVSSYTLSGAAMTGIPSTVPFTVTLNYAFRPQTILNVASDTMTSATYDSASGNYQMTTIADTPEGGYNTVADILAQTQKNSASNGIGRTAIVKDGKGTLTFDADQTLQAPLSVREGKVVIADGVTVTNGCAKDLLMISGTDAELVVDGGTYKQTTTGSTSSSGSSLSLAGYDGDGTLTIQNGGKVEILNSLYAGSSSAPKYPQPRSTDAMRPYYLQLGGTYTYVKTADLDTALADAQYRDTAADTAFADKNVSETGTRLSQGTLDISGASVMNVGRGLYLGNMTARIDGKGSSLNSGAEGGNPHYAYDTLGWGDKAHTTVNLTNGAALNSNAVRFDMGVGTESVVTVNVTGGSTLCHTQATETTSEETYASEIGYGDRSTATLNADGASHISYSGAIRTGYGTDSTAIINLKGRSDMTVNATDTEQWSYLGYGERSSSTVNIEGGSMLRFNGPLMAAYCSNGSVALNVSGSGSSFVSESTAYFTYGNGTSGSTFTATVSDGGALRVNSYAYIGSSEHTADLVATRGGSLYLPYLIMQDNSTLTIDSALGDNESVSTLYGDSTALRSGSTLINRGLVTNQFEDSTHTVTLYGGSRLQTGDAVISGRSEQNNAGDISIAYDSHLQNTTLSFATDDTGTVTIGAYLTGNGEMQYLTSADMDAVNTAVKTKLALTEDADHTIAYKHEIGEYISLTLDTDRLNAATGTEKIALNGADMVVEQGAGTDTTGTIGSYTGKATDTAAAVALHDGKASQLTWKGKELQTVAQESFKVGEGSKVTVSHSSEGTADGQMTVVAGSSMTVEGAVQAAEISVQEDAEMVNNGTLSGSVTVNGELRGSGAVEGAVMVTSTGTLIVGNSPGYQSVESLDLQAGSETVFSVGGPVASTSGNTGWGSDTYSQILVTDGSVTLAADACFTIEFGGELYVSYAQWGKEQSFELTLIKGGCGSLTEGELTTLLGNTIFELTDDAAALTGISSPSEWSVSVSDAAYSLSGNNLVLSGKMTLTPEPATTTLSLLALVGLCARRRRLR